jgi:hypothetical protein
VGEVRYLGPNGWGQRWDARNSAMLSRQCCMYAAVRISRGSDEDEEGLAVDDDREPIIGGPATDCLPWELYDEERLTLWRRAEICRQ